MGNNQVGHALEPDKELARTLLNAQSGDELDYTFLAQRHGAAKVRATRQELERSLTALNHYEPKLDGSMTRKLRDHLATIGTKIRPDLSADQATAWIDALVIAFSDLPPHVAVKAAERARHVPFQFPSEVEAKVRELATEHVERISAAIRRAQAVERAIHNALHPPAPLLTDRCDTDDPLSDDEVHDLQRKGGMCKAVLDLGIARGFILPSQLLPPDDPTIPQED